MREHAHRHLVVHAVDFNKCTGAHDLLDDASGSAVSFVDVYYVAE